MVGRLRRVGGPFGSDGGTRAQSAPLAVMLVFAMIVAGSTLVVAIGGTAISETQTQLGADRAENVMTQFDSQAAMVALGSSQTQSVTIPNDRGFRVDNDTGWVTVEYQNYGTGTSEKIVDEQALGAVTAEHGDRHIAYQGGGVWAKSNGGARMISPPEFHYRDATLTFPIITLSGDQSVQRKAMVSPNETVQYYPNESMNPDFVNPLTDGRVWVTIHSEYYEAWGEYFETRTDAKVEYDHAANTVTSTLVVPAEYPSVNSAVVSGAASSSMTINNNAELDSYNSSEGPYSTSSGSDTKISVAGDLVIEKGVVRGDVEVGGKLDFAHNNGELEDGNISYHESVDPSDPEAAGHWDRDPHHWIESNASVSAPDSVEGLINNRKESVEPDNDNDDVGTIDSEEIDCSSPCEIDDGSYYVDSFSLDNGDQLAFDTTDGDVHVVVDGPVNLDNNAVIEVVGDGRVNLFVEGDVELSQNAKIENTDDDSTQFWIYTNPDANADFRNGVEFRGVIFGPGAGGGPGTEIYLKNGAHVYGGLVGDLRIQENNVEIHYDEALSTAESVQDTNDLPALTFLHVSKNDVNVTSG